MLRSRELLALAVMITLPLPGLAETFEFTGKATSEDGRGLYSEKHQLEGECREGLFHPKTDRVRYLQDGNEFARKTLSYDQSPLLPSVDFRQPRFEESLAISYPRAGRTRIQWQAPSGEQKTWTIDTPEDLVVDAGFDNLVRENWARLKAGNDVRFRFLAPTRGDHYGFVLEPDDHPDINADLEVTIHPTGMLLGFLVDPIGLGYDRNGALTDYVGLTNIRKNSDENYRAHIRYNVTRWPECELTR
ncbi:hypothetical protein MSNKSG1_06253 [Marinobacter santoriniensis NKSG1]|uniref:Uncharacterized protein n=1 Tax=Marinobacter santoriniensis NKSG1 TaxID=1288826 RepID=M7CTG9_9GAMM|nr:hypothetical protein [Marinobacter santoriniensis]EMP55450.1 hypothetical protein MSNKSG1_06253 [Marinobacter santoriniensis NKSG1]